MFDCRNDEFDANLLRRARRGNSLSCICILAASWHRDSLSSRSRGGTPVSASSAAVDVLEKVLVHFSKMLRCTFSRGLIDAFVAHHTGNVLHR